VDRAPAAVLTVGHSTRPLEAFLALLRAHRVTLVADVRRMPGSRRHPHFGRDALAASLRAAGIGYAHLPALGGRRRPAPDSPNAGWTNASFRAYADHMLTGEFERGMADLLALARGQRVAVMCAEAVPWRCHRSLLADALVARGVAVEHVLGPERAEPHALRPWAEVQGARVTYPQRPDLAPRLDL
jgi:uncharacterized protein (DUF488 family)